MGKKKKQEPTISIQGENVVGTINADGKSRVSVSQSSVHGSGTDPEFEKLFKLLEEKVKARPEDPNVDKKEILDQVHQIKAEAAKGGNANQSKLERWIRNLAGMAPDIVDVIAASLAGPVPGFTAVIRKIAARVKSESGGNTQTGAHDANTSGPG